MDRRSQELDTATWMRVFNEAARLGVLHVHLSGGEPTARQDIVELTAHCVRSGLYTNLITSGVGAAEARLDALSDAGLDHVQLSIQAAHGDNAERIGGMSGAHAQKLNFARSVVERGLPLTVNAVIHRGNVGEVGDLIELAVAMRAKRLEIAHTQYYGWAQLNRSALMPTRAQADASIALVEEARRRFEGQIVIDLVLPDYYANYPKPCTGGWGRRTLNVTPSGKVLPCHAAETIPGLDFWSVKNRTLADVWWNSPAFNAFRGTDWMSEPCRSCDRKDRDWGGCRCQALALTGDASATDPACHKSPLHKPMQTLATSESSTSEPPPYVYRTIRSSPDKQPSDTKMTRLDGRASGPDP
ncbi:coenzyme PQQ synthesis protein E [Labrys miyagiensis]|uniref:PqqA peptide cyclase n=2 Tax=Labrys miyagiensis TaxID=346912 RepID=A0ABQ6CPT3_9HYPH|nr:coenzyme PQQ synthesis protein E [Labrys miyagiensis]